MKTVLITGGTGLFGCYLARYLKKKNFNVVVHGYSNIENSVCADLTDLAQTMQILTKTSPDYIINLIALTNVDECEIQPQKAYLLNVHTVENIAHWIGLQNKQCKFIQLSTDMLYNNEVGVVAKEKNINITNMYGMTKYAGELASLNVNAVILRTNFFGHSMHANRKSFSDWLLNAFDQKNKIKLFTDVCFSPLSMSSLSYNILLVMRNFQSGIYNLGSHQGLSKADFAQYLAQCLKVDLTFVDYVKASSVNLIAKRPTDMRMDVSLFETTFNTQLPCLKEEIEKVGQYEIQQRNKNSQ
jgi:dTDP-4-dehydrorhamnose reductase